MKAPMQYGVYTYLLVLLLRVQVLCTVHKVLYISRDPVTRYPVIYASTCTRTVQCVATYVGMCIYSAISAMAHESMYPTTYHMLCTVYTYCIYYCTGSTYMCVYHG